MSYFKLYEDLRTLRSQVKSNSTWHTIQRTEIDANPGVFVVRGTFKEFVFGDYRSPGSMSPVEITPGARYPIQSLLRDFICVSNDAN
jgi:hypothetical protein